MRDEIYSKNLKIFETLNDKSIFPVTMMTPLVWMSNFFFVNIHRRVSHESLESRTFQMNLKTFRILLLI